MEDKEVVVRLPKTHRRLTTPPLPPLNNITTNNNSRLRRNADRTSNSTRTTIRRATTVIVPTRVMLSLDMLMTRGEIEVIRSSEHLRMCYRKGRW
jgi:hypothetical protein